MELSPLVDALIAAFEQKTVSTKESQHFSVSRTVSTLARIYEKARNAVEFRAEHLVRRAAIERILKRRVMLGGSTTNIAENLVLELLWAKYVDSSLIDDTKVTEIHSIIKRYLLLKEHFFNANNKSGGVSWDTVLGLVSSEIEDTIVPAAKREALTNFVYHVMRPKIFIPGADERFINMQTYIAVERAYAQSDGPMITYGLLKLIEPDWFGLDPAKTADVAPNLLINIRLVEESLRDPIGEPLMHYVRTHTPPFLLIRDFFFENGDKSREIIEHKETLELKLSEIASKRYQEIGAKVRRGVVRSIIYIFCTKMIFALALEAPFDLFISHKLEYLALTVNTLFPPVLLYLVAGFTSVPGADNTHRLITRIKKIFYEFDELEKETDVFTPKKSEKRPILTAVFSFFYLVTFLISFGLISFILTRLHFNIASQIIFVFFVTLVSFFAYRIRASAKEYEMIERQGFLAPVVDFFFLPILRVGHLLSREIAKINVLLFFFDFILEAPLKVIFEVVEEWIRFIRTKKDEII